MGGPLTFEVEILYYRTAKSRRRSKVKVETPEGDHPTIEASDLGLKPGYYPQRVVELRRGGLRNTYHLTTVDDFGAEYCDRRGVVRFEIHND